MTYSEGERAGVEDVFKIQKTWLSFISKLCVHPFTLERFKMGSGSVEQSLTFWRHIEINIYIMCAYVLSHFSFVWLLLTPWSVALQTPLLWNSLGRNTGVGRHALHQGIFLTQGLNLCLLHCRWSLYPLSLLGSLLFVCNINNKYQCMFILSVLSCFELHIVNTWCKKFEIKIF